MPAVVLFSLGLGIALVPIANKETLFEKIDILIDALARLNKLVVRLSPIGIFAIAGHIEVLAYKLEFFNFDSQLLQHFPFQGIFQALVGFHMSSRQTHNSGVNGFVPPAAFNQKLVTFYYYSNNNAYSFQDLHSPLFLE